MSDETRPSRSRARPRPELISGSSDTEISLSNSYDSSQEYRKFIVRSTCDSDERRAKIFAQQYRKLTYEETYDDQTFLYRNTSEMLKRRTRKCGTGTAFPARPFFFSRSSCVTQDSGVLHYSASINQPPPPPHRRLPACLRVHSGAARGGEAFPYGWMSENYVICVCFHCHGTSSYHATNTLQDRRAKSHVDTQTIQPGLGDFVL